MDVYLYSLYLVFWLLFIPSRIVIFVCTQSCERKITVLTVGCISPLLHNEQHDEPDIYLCSNLWGCKDWLIWASASAAIIQITVYRAKAVRRSWLDHCRFLSPTPHAAFIICTLLVLNHFLKINFLCVSFLPSFFILNTSMHLCIWQPL